jgi:hypothetical protein
MKNEKTQPVYEFVFIEKRACQLDNRVLNYLAGLAITPYRNAYS